MLNDGITLINTEKNKFETYADDFEGNETSLFLTEMNRGKKYSTRSKLLFFRDVHMIGFRIIFRLSHRIRH